MPSLLSADLGIGEKGYKSDPSVYGRVYEPTIGKYVKKLGLKPGTFLAQKGDVLFWHAHLLHGGAPRNNLALSRKALVCHYFAEGSFTYHDLAGNPSRLHKNGVFAPPAIDWRERLRALTSPPAPAPPPSPAARPAPRVRRSGGR